MAYLRKWTVDYGKGSKPCTVPHAWRQDVDVRWEGPAIYRTTISVPKGKSWLLFHGVSYAAKVFVKDKLLGEHRGIWDAFSFSLSKFAGKKVELRVEVVKNGGKSFPVKDVASGFLPYVFNTFGGIYQDVELIQSAKDPLLPRSNPTPPRGGSPKRKSTKSAHPEGGAGLYIAAKPPKQRVRVDGTKIFVDRKPFYLRAPLTWGWYPDVGHTNPPEKEIRREVKLAKKMGFNTMKFCLWVPPHRYFEILDEEGMFAWLELPLWDPTPDPKKQEVMFKELERIVHQYRHHDNIIVWTCGCELSSNTTAEFRERLYKMVKRLTGSPLVKDNSGGSEMYGGDLREFGDFYDFHPYCDLPFYPLVLDSLMPGPRKKMPVLLGEFNDVDVHRDLARLRKERPYWTSTDPKLNDQGVRWQHDLPAILADRDWNETGDAAIEQESWYKACFIRKHVQEAVRSHSEISGYVLTGWRDTPISSSGLVDDWYQPRLTFEANTWNNDDQIFLMPSRRPPWIKGGNRPGWIDTYNYFLGPVHLRIGAHCSQVPRGSCRWWIHEPSKHKVIEKGTFDANVVALTPSEIGDVHWMPKTEGSYLFRAEIGKTSSGWIVEVFRKPEFSNVVDWRIEDPKGKLDGIMFQGGANVISTELRAGELLSSALEHKCIQLLDGPLTRPAPFWRECIQKIQHGLFPGFRLDWENLLPISSDCVIDLDALHSVLPKNSEIRTLINRIDTRTYKEAPIMVEVKCGKGRMLATTLRPYGGLGIQPYGVMNNPAGAALLESMMRYLEAE
jgi:hypothetical protein